LIYTLSLACAGVEGYCVCLFGLQEMGNINIVEAARTGSLQRVKQALNGGVPVDTTDEVCNFDIYQRQSVAVYMYTVVGIYSYSPP